MHGICLVSLNPQRIDPFVPEAAMNPTIPINPTIDEIPTPSAQPPDEPKHVVETREISSEEFEKISKMLDEKNAELYRRLS